MVYRTQTETGHIGFRQRSINHKTVADSLNTRYPEISFHHPHQKRHNDNRNQRTRDFFRKLRSNHNQNDTQYTDQSGPQMNSGSTFEISSPFRKKISRHAFHRQAEQIFHLRGKNGQCNTTGKTDNYRIRYKLNHCTQLQKTHQQ